MEVERSKKESMKKRKISISNLPDKISLEEMKKELFYSQNFKVSYVSLEGNSAQVTLADVNEAKRAAKLINGQLFKGKRISVTLSPSSSSSSPSGGLLVVGNLPFDYTEDQFRKLMSPHGEIKKLFLVRNKNTGQSKGYGFVEYVRKDCATRAKDQFTKTSDKFVNNRIIRVDFATPNLLVDKEQHSKTLFIDHLPKSFHDDEYLKDLFSKTGTVTFCKVAINTTNGAPRGFAFVDYETVEEAEQSQEYHDGTQIGDSNIRVTFCTPGKTAREIFGKFDDQNNRDRGRGNPTFHAAAPGMGGPRGPRIPLVIGNSPAMLPVERLPRPGMGPMPPRGTIRGPRPFGPGGPRMPRILGPEGAQLHARPRFVARTSLEAQGPRLRIPFSRPPNARTVRPKSQSTFSNKKNNESTKTSSSWVKPKDVGSKSSKTNDSSSSAKNSTPSSKEKEAKEESSSTDALSELQKLGANALAAAMGQSSTDGSKVKVLQPVVFMDAEQFQQFQQFQQLMQKQKEAQDSSGDSVAVSLEELVKGQQKEPQKSEALSETPVSPKREPPSQKPSTAPKNPAQGTLKPAPSAQPLALTKQRQSTQQEKRSPKKLSPRRPIQQMQQQQQRQQRHLPTEQSPRRAIQQQEQRQQRQQQQEQKNVKAVGAYKWERKQNGVQDSYYGSKQNKKPVTSATNVPPLEPPPKMPIEPHILQKLFQGSNKRPLDEPARQEYPEKRLGPSSEYSSKMVGGQVESHSPYPSHYKTTGQSLMKTHESQSTPRSIQPLQSGYKQQYQSTDGKDRINAPKRSPANDRETTSREQSYNRSRYAYLETSQRERSSGDAEHGQTLAARYNRERKEDQEQENYLRTRSDVQARRERDSLPAREARSAFDTSVQRDTMPPRDIRSVRDALAAGDLRSLRDIIPSRDTIPPREALPSRDKLARDLPQRDFRQRESLSSRDTLSARDTLPSRDALPPRTALTPRDTRSARDPVSNMYDREMSAAFRERDSSSLRREREPLPPRYKLTDMSPGVSREALDRARYQRVVAERYEREKEYPRYEKEQMEPRYSRSATSRESAVGSTRGPSSHYPLEGPVSKRPRY